MKQKIRWMALALAVCLALTGCVSTPGQESPSPSGEAGSPAAGHEGLAVSLAGSPSTLDPTLADSAQEVAVLSHLFEGLMKWAPSGRDMDDGVEWAGVVPGMAERYERTQEEELVIYTFHLRSASWSDGKPVTAQDFVYAWQRMAASGNNTAYADLFQSVVGAYAISVGMASQEDLGVRAVDDSTFEVALYRDDPWFLELCAMPCTAPLRQDKIQEGGSRWTTGETFVTDGPYRLKSMEYDYLVLEKNPGYYDPAPGPESLTISFRSSAAADLSAYEAGELDFLQEVTAENARQAPYLASYYVTFQNARAPFDDVRVRQAFSLAIDRNKLVAQQAPGQIPAGGLVSPGTDGPDGAAGADYRARTIESVDVSAKAYSDNCKTARELLAQAGYPEGRGFPEITYLCPDNPAHTAIGEALCQMWQEALGVTVTVESVGWSAFLSRCHAGEYAMARGRWVADYNDPMAFLELWHSESAGNDAKYHEPEFDGLLEKADQTADPAGRMEILARAEERLIGEDWVLAPLYYETQSYLKGEDLRGVCYTPLGFFLFTQSTKG